jgi:hypothetical protein
MPLSVGPSVVLVGGLFIWGSIKLAEARLLLHHRPAGGVGREPRYHRVHERRDWSRGRRPEDDGRPKYNEECRDRSGRAAARPRRDVPVLGRNKEDWRDPRNGESRRGELGGSGGVVLRSDATRPPCIVAATSSRYAVRCVKREAGGLSHPDHHLAPPRACSAPHRTVDAGGAPRAPPLERDWAQARARLGVRARPVLGLET